MKLEHDLIIPAGTEFTRIDGTKREYVEGNYEALIAAGADHTISVVMEPEVIEALSRPVRLEGWRIMDQTGESRPLTGEDYGHSSLVLIHPEEATSAR